MKMVLRLISTSAQKRNTLGSVRTAVLCTNNYECVCDYEHVSCFLTTDKHKDEDKVKWNYG